MNSIWLPYKIYLTSSTKATKNNTKNWICFYNLPVFQLVKKFQDVVAFIYQRQDHVCCEYYICIADFSDDFQSIHKYTTRNGGQGCSIPKILLLGPF